MIIFSRNKRIDEIDTQLDALFFRVKEGGDHCSEQCTDGIRCALIIAANMQIRGAADSTIFHALAERGTPIKGQPSCEQLGFGLVSFLYECRAARSRKGLHLAMKIYDSISTILESRLNLLETRLGINVEHSVPDGISISDQHREILRKYGYNDEVINDMNPEEAAQEVEDAIANGIPRGGR